MLPARFRPLPLVDPPSVNARARGRAKDSTFVAVLPSARQKWPKVAKSYHSGAFGRQNPDKSAETIMIKEMLIRV